MIIQILIAPDLIVGSIIFLAIGIAVAAALFGSTALQSLTPINEAVLSPTEQKCQQIANEGYKIHALYPDSNPDELPESDMQRMMALDEVWIKECVAVLPHETILQIANNVKRDISSGE